MITDIPTPQEFESNGLVLLNLAWTSILELSRNLHESAKYLAAHSEVAREEQQEIDRTYWEQAQPALAVAVALAHQGGEFLLKSRIAQVSPFLLLANDPSKWPSRVDREDKSFADFKTVDAQDLIKLHDSVCNTRLTDDFKRRFEELRRLRNTIMHSVDKRSPFTARDGIVAVLHIADNLFGEKCWQKIRHDYKNQKVNFTDPYCLSDFNPAHPFAMDTLHVIDVLLQPAEVRRFYDFDRDGRRYICLSCHEEYAGGFVFSCQLKPNEPNSTTLFCICCLESFEVRRQDCTFGGCKGNVLGKDRWDDGYCCRTCGTAIETPDEDPDSSAVL